MRTSTQALALLVPLLTPACQEAPDPGPSEARGALVDRGPTQPPASAPTPPGAPAATSFDFAPVDWAALDAAPRLAPGALSADQARALRPDELPVLLPDTPLAAATLSRGPGWYSASVPLDGHHVVVHGTRLRFGGTTLEPDRPWRITRMDGIVEADLTRFGAAYTVAVECAAPGTDPRCADDAYVRGLAETLRALPRGAR